MIIQIYFNHQPSTVIQDSTYHSSSAAIEQSDNSDKSLQTKTSKTNHVKQGLKLISSIILHTCVILFAIRRSYGEICLHYDDTEYNANEPFFPIRCILNYFYCGSPLEYHVDSIYMMDDVVLMLMIFPPIGFLASPGTNSLPVVWVMATISMLVYIGIFAVRGLCPPIHILFFWLMANILIPVYAHGRDIKMFLLHQRLQEYAKKDAERQEEQHLTEMRFVIANVAHDLKTVSVIPLPSIFCLIFFFLLQ
jgi:hypothetical protein